MNNQIYLLTLRTENGLDILTNAYVRFKEQPCDFVTYEGSVFKKFLEMKTAVFYSRIPSCDVLSILYFGEKL
jgi:hypothetical protein